MVVVSSRIGGEPAGEGVGENIMVEWYLFDLRFQRE